MCAGSQGVIWVGPDDLTAMMGRAHGQKPLTAEGAEKSPEDAEKTVCESVGACCEPAAGLAYVISRVVSWVRTCGSVLRP